MIDSGLLGRIRRVAALTTSSNAHEAAVAAAKLTDLLIKHNLSMEDIGTEQAKERYGVGEVVVAMSSFHRTFWATVAKHHFCRALFFAGSQRMLLVGEPENVAVVKWMVPWLLEQMNPLAYQAYDAYRAQCTRWGETPAKAKGWMKTFRWGVMHEVDMRMRELYAGLQAESKALVVVKDAEVDDAVSRLVGQTRDVKHKVHGNEEAYAAGRQAGKQLQLERERQVAGGNLALQA